MLELNEIYHLDCIEFLDQLANESVDLAIIDPPYFLNKAKWDTFDSQEAFLKFTYNWIDHLLPKLKPAGSFYVFNTPFNSAYILGYLTAKKMKFRNWITWDKRDGFSQATKKYANGQETILFFTKSDTYTFNADDIRVPYESTERIAHAAKTGILKNGKRWFPNPNGRLVGEVWHMSSQRHLEKVNGKTPKLAHLTPKPLAMIERMVLASSKPGELVLDCFAGSGTTLVAAAMHHRQYIGCDSDPKYVTYSRNRIQDYASNQHQPK